MAEHSRVWLFENSVPNMYVNVDHVSRLWVDGTALYLQLSGPTDVVFHTFPTAAEAFAAMAVWVERIDKHRSLETT